MNDRPEPPARSPKPLSRRELLNLLTAAFNTAAAAAAAADPGPAQDRGAKNLDCPAIHLPRAPQAIIRLAALNAGLQASPFTWFGQRWFWLSGLHAGEASRRTRMAEVATEALRDANIPGLEVRTYYTMRRRQPR